MAEGEETYAEQIVATVSQPVVVLTGALEVERVNPAFCRAFELSAEESQGRQLYDLGNKQWDIPELRRLLEEVLTERTAVTDYRVEHEFERIGSRTMLISARRMPRDRIVLAIDDVSEFERLRFELEGRVEFAEKLIDSVREGLLILGWDLCVQSANQPFYDHFRVDPDETVGRKVYQLGNGQWDIPELRELLERILPEEESFDDYEVEHEFEQIGRRTMLLNARRLDHLDLIILAIRDVTERRDHERQQQLFMGELQHRVKNLLNNVRALANQMRRRSTDLDQFFEGFTARLGALSRAQDLLIRRPDHDVEFADVVHAELEAVGAEPSKDYTARGPAVQLSPRDAQTMAMAIHELATNAGKHGALKARGRIAIEWRIEQGESEDFVFNWRERGVEIDETARKTGFGSEVIEKSLPHMLGGTAELLLHGDGAECRVRFPLRTGGGRR